MKIFNREFQMTTLTCCFPSKCPQFPSVCSQLMLDCLTIFISLEGVGVKHEERGKLSSRKIWTKMSTIFVQLMSHKDLDKYIRTFTYLKQLVQLRTIIGPSGVVALPLAAGINKGGHQFRYFSFLLPPLFKTTEGVVVGFQIFAWAPK